jgi:hypothetical protein
MKLWRNRLLAFSRKLAAVAILVGSRSGIYGPAGSGVDDGGLANLASSIGTFCRNCSTWKVKLSPGWATVLRNGVATPSTFR